MKREAVSSQSTAAVTHPLSPAGRRLSVLPKQCHSLAPNVQMPEPTGDTSHLNLHISWVWYCNHFLFTSTLSRKRQPTLFCTVTCFEKESTGNSKLTVKHHCPATFRHYHVKWWNFFHRSQVPPRSSTECACVGGACPLESPPRLVLSIVIGCPVASSIVTLQVFFFNPESLIDHYLSLEMNILKLHPQTP